MATITGQEILSRAGVILQDTTSVKWPIAELLDWLHDAQREIVLRKPDAYSKNTSIQLTVSQTKQSIPSDGVMLLDVVRNLGTDGSTPGRAITRTERPILDQQRPDWHTDTPSATVKHYMFNEKDPKTFYVYPPQPGSSPGHVEIIYSAAPDPLIATWQASTAYSEGDYCLPRKKNNHLYIIGSGDNGTSGTSEPTWPTTDGGTVVDGTCTWTETDFIVPQVITLDDIYEAAILDYILYRAYSKDANLSPSAPQRAMAHFNAFMGVITGQEQAEVAYDPNVQSPANPSSRGV